LRLSEDKNERALAEFLNLLKRDDEATLAEFFENERASQRLKDDDIAVLCIEAVKI